MNCQLTAEAVRRWHLGRSGERVGEREESLQNGERQSMPEIFLKKESPPFIRKYSEQEVSTVLITAQKLA